MNGSSSRNELFYRIKPLIPRRIQIALRRRLARRTVARLGKDWYINNRAGGVPRGWKGWPDGKKFALVLRHDVETAVGHDRCLQLQHLEHIRGFQSSFYFVPERYAVSPNLRRKLEQTGFEVGVHGLYHDGRLYQSRDLFDQRATKINEYLAEWNSRGFCSPASHHVLEWNHRLDIEYDSSTFDTAPFEPQPDNVNTVFPFWVADTARPGQGYVELPYSLTQDFYVFIILQEKTNDIWKKKLDWIAEKGGMALLITHPDYISFDSDRTSFQEYPSALYEDFLEYVQTRYAGEYWNATTAEVAAFYKRQMDLQPQPNTHHPASGLIFSKTLANGKYSLSY